MREQDDTLASFGPFHPVLRSGEASAGTALLCRTCLRRRSVCVLARAVSFSLTPNTMSFPVAIPRSGMEGRARAAARTDDDTRCMAEEEERREGREGRSSAAANQQTEEAMESERSAHRRQASIAYTWCDTLVTS